MADAWVDYGVTLNRVTTGAGGGTANGRLWSFAGNAGAGPTAPLPHESLAFCCHPGPPTGSIEGIVTDADTGLYTLSVDVPVIGEEHIEPFIRDGKVCAEMETEVFLRRIGSHAEDAT